MNVYDKARELVEALKQEDVYTEFVERQNAVFGDSEHQGMLLDLRNKEFEIHRRQLLGKEVSEDQKETLQKLYEIAKQHPAVGSYLEAEYRFSRMMMDIQRIINDAVPIKRPDGKR